MEKLTVVTREMNEEDCEYYNRVGWKNFHEDDLTEIKLPELGDPIYFSERHSLHDPENRIVVEIRGRRYQFFLHDHYRNERSRPDGKSIELTPTELPLTVPDASSRPGEWRGWYYLKFFGQPTWVQGAKYGCDSLGNPLHQLLTIESGWGDCGNENILVGFDQDGNVSEAFFEASCC